MKEDTRWKVMAGVLLITATLLLMTIHYLIFHDSHHLFIYFVGDLVFIPIEVLCVTLIIDQMLESRKRQERMEKLNMVIGIFFSRIGTPLLALLAKADPCSGQIRDQFLSGSDWNPGKFQAAHSGISRIKCMIDPSRTDLEAIRKHLCSQEDFLVRIVENPMVFEHESFTDLILSVTHLVEELRARDDLSRLPPSDIAHLTVDLERVYFQMVPEWLKYMEYLHRSYPYLFSLAMRQNPFDETVRIVVE